MSENFDYDYSFNILLIGNCIEHKSKILLNIFDNNKDEEKFVTTIGVDVRINK